MTRTYSLNISDSEKKVSSTNETDTSKNLNVTTTDVKELEELLRLAGLSVTISEPKEKENVMPANQMVVEPSAIAPSAEVTLMDDNEIKTLARLSNVAYESAVAPVTESVLTETHSLRASILVALHNLGKSMLDLGSKAIDVKSDDFSDEKLDDMNRMLRVGEMLTSLGEPFSTPLEKFKTSDIEYIAKKLKTTPEKFLKVTGIKHDLAKDEDETFDDLSIAESIVNLVSYGDKNNMLPLSKNQTSVKQTRVNNSGNNSMKSETIDSKAKNK